MKLYQILIISALLFSCKATFNFTGGAVNTELETLGVAQFINESDLVVPGLDQDLTIALQDRFLSQSRLQLTDGPADINLSGAITNYRVDPVAYTGNERAAQNRLIINLKVKYENNVDPEDNWEQSFSAFSDFDATLDFSTVEAEQIELIIDQLTQDIFNKSLGKW